MEEKYIVSIDQSTQGTKGLLFNSRGELIKREDKSHEQIVNAEGWVSHNPMEIYENVLLVVKKLLKGIEKSKVVGLGISNQRETSLVWDRKTGLPLGNAIVWQCKRAVEICEREKIKQNADKIREKTGMPLSPYFPAAKIAWLLENQQGVSELLKKGQLCHGTMDTWLIYKLTGGISYKTDYSNASRTQLFNIFDLSWDEEICSLFGIDSKNMPQVCDSDALYGETDFEGVLPCKIPICGVMGDSHGALFGQGCISTGMTKATYGTGSSIMMNIGKYPVLSQSGLVTSLAWKVNGEVSYVLEGNLNYTGAVISWLKNDLELIDSPKETEKLAKEAIKDDSLYLVPAFSGLGAPYWKSDAKAAFVGMTRTSKKREFVRSALESIAYQITDVLQAMKNDAKTKLDKLKVDGGPTRNAYLMQFQGDIADVKVEIPNAEELSGIGVAYLAGLRLGIWGEEIFERLERKIYSPQMKKEKRKEKYLGWQKAVQTVISEDLK